MQLTPMQAVPTLQVDTVDRGLWDLTAPENRPECLTLVVFYRGLHCSICRQYLQQLESNLRAFAALGVNVIAVSGDTQQRAERAKREWGLNSLLIGYEFGLHKAEQWGLYVSDALEPDPSALVDEPDQFLEPGVFLVDPQGRLYGSIIQTMPFARPPIEQLVKACQTIIEKHYPARGQAVAA